MSKRKYGQGDSNTSEMRRMKKSLRDVELRLISELMKNSRKSDRELARAIGVTQPTVNRLRTKLEKTGVIKEYTMIPDFNQLGYQIMDFTPFKLRAASEEQEMELKKAASKMDQQNAFANMIVARGFGMGKNRIFLTFYRDYAEYIRNMKDVKRLPNVNIESLESFLIDLRDDFSYRILSMKQIARSLEPSMESVEP